MKEYIEREAVMERLRRMPIPKQAGRGNTWLDNCAAGVNAAIREVASFPAADVAEVRHGRWVNTKNEVEQICKCSECGYPISYFWSRTPYCPNCGARMDKEASHEVSE